MPYYSYSDNQSASIASLAEALERETVDNLKKFAALLPTAEKPKRKPELIALILRHLEGNALYEFWRRLDAMQQAAVAEVVHASDSRFHEDRFTAKYGQEPDWGVRHEYSYGWEPSRLHLFFYRGLMPEDLKQRLKVFVPQPEMVRIKTIDEVPTVFNLESTLFDYSTKTSTHEVEEIPVEQRMMEYTAQHDLIAVLRLVST